MLDGAVAFKLHDTYGFPIDLTVEVAGERGVAVDREGFEAEMAEQRVRAAEAADRWTTSAGGRARSWAFGPTVFLGYAERGRAPSLVVGTERARRRVRRDGGAPRGRRARRRLPRPHPLLRRRRRPGRRHRRRSPADGGFRGSSTRRRAGGRSSHTGYVVEGASPPAEEAVATIDGDAARRSGATTPRRTYCTGALRTVLGEHVKQQGSLVAPDRLRFDFSHFAAVTRRSSRRSSRHGQRAASSPTPVRDDETSRRGGEEGAIAFFGEKYGEQVRVVAPGRTRSSCAVAPTSRRSARSGRSGSSRSPRSGRTRAASRR